jgi:hypothetical protein
MIVSAYTGEAVHHLKSGRVKRFRPTGELLLVTSEGHRRGAKERAKNPIEKLGEGGLSARIFVGLSVGQEPRFSIDDVVKATIDIRKGQKELPDASFLAQRGVYTEGATGQLVTEDSVQIVVIDLVGATEPVFTKQMTDLAEKLRSRFEQESTIVEIQNKGVAQAVYSVTA